ncbi:TauD/TfdA family dioxygenase [Actinomadura sp. LOL_016]|uniref:TauD/TfdA family dioxygenase n=1 Tax=unclassified Actinomadura TaxID=2626254 RepID=UPI003A80C5A7
MSPHLRALDDVLTPHPVGPDTPRVIAERLRGVGLVVLDGLTSRAEVLALASQVMDVTAHRDSDADGLTTICDTGRHQGRSGFAGFTNGELAPHTERSGTSVPPRLMLLVCANPAPVGGESLLTDARTVHAELIQHRRDAAAALSTPRTAFFGAGDGHATQVFTAHADHRIAMRLRLDDLARWSPLVQPYVRDLRATAVAHQLALPLAAGQGYLLDNSRWLHARNAFTGRRLCWRALGEPKFPLAPGFAADRTWSHD